MKTYQLKGLKLFCVSIIILLGVNVFAQQDEERKPPPVFEDEHFKAPHMMKPPKHQKGLPPIPDLTEEQKEQIKELEINNMKEVLSLKNQMGERESQLRTLSTADNVDINSIYELIEEIGELKTQMMKQEAALHQEIRKILTDDQRVFFDMGPQHPEMPRGKR
jgi:Spy/CpxP family protein refolding chaperone